MLHFCKLTQEAARCDAKQRPFRIRKPGMGALLHSCDLPTYVGKVIGLSEHSACLGNWITSSPTNATGNMSFLCLSPSVTHGHLHRIMSELQEMPLIIFPVGPGPYQPSYPPSLLTLSSGCLGACGISTPGNASHLLLTLCQEDSCSSLGSLPPEGIPASHSPHRNHVVATVSFLHNRHLKPPSRHFPH